MTIKKQTLLSIIGALKCASKDLTRYHLTGVYIDTKNIVTTDGHKMVIIPHGETIFKESYWIGPEQIPILKLVLKSYPKSIDDIQCLTVDGGINVLGFGDTPITTLLKTAKSQSINYPNYQTIIPTHDDTLKVSLNAEYILQVAESLKTTSKFPNVTFNFKSAGVGIDHLSPVMVKMDGNMGVIMPCRM